MSKRLKVLAGVAGVALAASMLAAMPAGAAASKAATAKSATPARTLSLFDTSNLFLLGLIRGRTRER